MLIHLSKDGAQLGAFPEDEVRAKLASGEIAWTDLAWRDGMGDWQPLSSVLGAQGAPPMPRPVFEGGRAQQPSAQPQSNGLAVASLVCGILAILTCGLTSIPAVVMGHIALSKVKRSGGTLGGRGLAMGGLVTGYIMLILLPVIAIIASLAVPTYNLIQVQADQMKAASNCKEIVSLLHRYAADNNSVYPDSVINPATGKVPASSNDAFRALFQEELATNEIIFGSPSSRFNPDGNIGSPPTFENALEAGENHWAMTAGQSSSSSSIMPLVFENPISTEWPPKWDADAGGKPMPGRAWQGGKIVVGKNDGSAEVIKLDSSSGPAGPRMLGHGKDMFTQASDGAPQTILNILTR